MPASRSPQNHDLKKTKAELIAELEERIFGFSPNEVIGQSIDMLLPDEVRDIHRKYVEEFAEDNEPSRMMGQRSEVIGVKRNGERFPAEASISKIQVENKTYFTVILRDISRRKSAEQALREKERLLQLIADTVPANIMYMDAERKYKFVNKTYTNWMRLSREEVIGKHITEVVPPEAYKFIEPHVEQALGGNRVDYEGKLTYPDEITRDFHASLVPTFEADGTVSGFAGLVEDITEHKRIADALRESQRLLQTVFDTIPIGVQVKDLSGKYIMVNRWMADLYGHSPEELKGKTYRQVGIGTREQQQLVEEDDRQVIERGEMVDVDSSPLTLKDGRTVWRRRIKVPLRDEAGNLVGMVGVMEDITDRKQAEEALRESENLLQLIADTVPVNIVYMDAEQNYKFVNKTYTDWMRLSAEEVIGKHITEVVPPEAYKFVKPQVEQALGGNRVDYEGKFTFPDEITREFHASYVPTFEADGTVSGFAGLIEDITERRQADEALRESEERFRATFNNSPQAIFLKSREGRYIMVNRQFEKWNEASSHEVIGKTAYEIYTSEVADKFAAQDQEVIDSGQEVVREVDLDMNDGVRRKVILSKFPLFDADGKVTEVGTISTDVTEQRNTEQQLRESQKMEAIGQLAGGIAHEFNNMLQIVTSCARILNDGSIDLQRDRKLVDTILKTSERSAELTRQLLAFSRRSILRPISLNLDELISNQLKMLRQVIGEHIEIGFQAEEGLWAVSVDPGIMEQINLNLCINARDAMPDGGEILIKLKNVSADEKFRGMHRLENPGHYVAVTVSDNGAGMSSEIRERIFEPFFTTKKVGQGTGLGLAIVQGAVQQHHGVVEVTSEPNNGTTVTIYLPRAEERKEKQEKPSTTIVAGGSETILVAEDQEDVLHMMSRTLESKGYMVIAAKDGEEAWSAFKANSDRINLVILDMIMPIKQGRLVFEEIRNYGSRVPVLFHSGYSPDSDQAEFLRTNELRLLRKPYGQEELFSAVREILDRN